MDDKTATAKRCCLGKACGDGLPAVVPAPGDAALAGLCWALAHPARVAIVRLLAARDSCVCGEIVDRLPLAQSTVSQHLKILKLSGLVTGTVSGPRTCYCLDRYAVKRLKELVAGL